MLFMEDAKLLESGLSDVYQNSYWYFSEDDLKTILKYRDMGDIRAQIILMVDLFKKSPVVVNKKGVQISPLHKVHKDTIKFFNSTIELLENRDDVSDLVKIKVENEFYNSKVGIICCCYRALGHIYSGKWGKIPLDFEKGKQCYLKADKLSGVESYETEHYKKGIIKENYFLVLKQQIDNRGPNDYIKDSVRKSEINPYPTDPDLHAEASGKDK